ncbi:uncharacterized protein LOC134208995 [Armigeres subalbatus]|uniref:uncharacterized protein LOC134208995 n=1 Tax=Armigeres subalbatus TaxID=124917 RepID=UPI002ED5A860
MSINPTSEPFIPGTIPFSQYQEQLEWMFEHNNYTEDRYKTSFLAVCGTEVFSQLKLLFPGQSLRELTYKQITDKLKQRYDKKDSDVIHSYRFWTRRQGQYEKAVDFVLDVKHLAEQCEFGDFKSRAIRDVLVIGLNDRGLQKRLFDEDDLTAAKAEKIIVNQELASDRTLILSTDDDKKPGIVARLGRKDDKPYRQSRFRSRSRSDSRSWPSDSRRNDRYNNKNHYSEKQFVCSYCKKKGHVRKYCYRLRNKSPRKSQTSVKFLDSPKPSSSGTDGLFKRLKEDMESDSDDELPCMMIASVNKISEPCYVETIIEKKRITMEIDSGSAESVISENMYMRCFKNLPLESCNKRLVVIDGKS